MRMRALALAFVTVGLATSIAAAQEAPAAEGDAPAAAPEPAPAEAAAPEQPAPVQAAPAPPAPVQAAPAQPAAPVPVQAAPAQAAPAPVYQAPPQPAPVYQTPPPQPAPVYQAPAPAPAPVYQAPAPQAPAYNPYAAPAPGSFTPYSSPLTPGGGRPSYQLPPPAWNAPRVAQAQPAPTYVLPPPPNGYMYMPVPLQQAPVPSVSLASPDVARRDQIYAELQQTEMRLAQLKQDKISVGGPVTLLVLGFGTTVVAGLIGLGNFASAERIQHQDYDPYYDQGELDKNNDGKINGHDAHAFRENARIAGAVAAGGLLLGIIGAVRLSTKREQKRKRAFEMRSLAHQRDNLRNQLGLSAATVPGYYGVSVQGGF